MDFVDNGVTVVNYDFVHRIFMEKKNQLKTNKLTEINIFISIT